MSNFCDILLENALNKNLLSEYFGRHTFYVAISKNVAVYAIPLFACVACGLHVSIQCGRLTSRETPLEMRKASIGFCGSSSYWNSRSPPVRIVPPTICEINVHNGRNKRRVTLCAKTCNDRAETVVKPISFVFYHPANSSPCMILAEKQIAHAHIKIKNII